MTNIEDLSIVVLITTFNRPELLDERALESVYNQSLHPKQIVVVDNSDSERTRALNRNLFLNRFPDGEYQVNNGPPSAAGTWNQGLHWIQHNHPDAFVAILDDDDEWLPNHLELCSSLCENHDAVISGIRTILDRRAIEDRTPESFSISDFFATNPGWQGSNTFAKVSSLLSAGGFDEELSCTHDRDLAIRCLSLPSFRIAFTGQVSTLYHLETERDSLTMTKGHGKHTGLLQFHKKHRKIMQNNDERKFIERAVNLFGIDANLFAITETSNDHAGWPVVTRRNDSNYALAIRKSVHRIRTSWWKLRTHQFMTRLLGRQFSRTREKIEIDITYACNLRCHDCNRSCRQAPENSELGLEAIEQFIDESLERRLEWKRIRLLGGEPTLHSAFEEILYALARYKLSYPRCRMEVVSNGHGRYVKRKLLQVPPFFHIENTQKENDLQPFFYSFNLAPKDNPRHKKTDFTNGCSNIVDCGIGLTPSGYYPCAIAGGIDRVAGWNMGRQSIPSDDDEMLDLLKKFCSHCGRFEKRKFTPPELMPAYSPGQTSSSWETIYETWRSNG